MALTQFAQSLLLTSERRNEAIKFLICLDFLVKGALIHYSIKIKESGDSRGRDIMKGMETKFPLLLGDQYHSMAYYMITRTGSVELTRLISMVEENLWKIFYNVEKFPSDFSENLKFIYQHFYNYLPQFLGNSFKGLGVIVDLGPDGILQARDAGIELGFMYQFGIFSYIMTAVVNRTKKESVKEKLEQMSSILQYVSFETLE